MANLGEMLRQQYSDELQSLNSDTPTPPADPSAPAPIGEGVVGPKAEVPTGGVPTTALTMQQTRGRGEQAYQQIGSAPSPDAAASNPISSFLTAAKDNLGVAAYAAANLATKGGVDTAIDSVLGKATGGQEASAMTAADRVSMGTIDSLAGGKAQLNALLTGKGQEKASEIGSTVRDQVNLNLMDTREEYPLSSMGGDVAGTILTGAPVLKGVQGLIGTGRYFLAPAMAAGSEEFVYQLNSDASLSKAAIKAGTASVLAGTFSSLFTGIGAGSSYLFGKSKSRLSQEFGGEIVSMAMQKAARQGQDMTEAQAVKMIQDAGPEAYISDLLPELGPRLFSMASSPDKKVIDRGLKMLRARSDMEFGYRDQILRTIQGNVAPRSEMAYKNYATLAQKRLSPQYTKLFDNMDAAQWQKEVPTIRDTITTLINPDLPQAGDDLSKIMQIIGGATKGRPRITFREVNEARKKIGNEVYQRIRNNNSNSNNTALPIENLKMAQNTLRDLLNTNSEFRRLQGVYGDLEESKNAYEFGRKLITSSKIEGSDADLFLEGNSSSMVAEALAEGARYGLYAAAKNPKNPVTALKDARLDDLAAVIGKEPVDALRENIQKLINAERTTEAVSKGLSARGSGENAEFLGQKLADMTTIGGGSSGPATRFAIGRVLNSLQGRGTPVQRELTKAGDVQSRAMMEAGGGIRPAEAFLNNQAKVPKAQLAGVGLSNTQKDTAATDTISGMLEASGGSASAMLEWMMNNQPNQ